MKTSNIALIIRREYYERVYRKSFIITTILMPVLMFGLMCAPAAIFLLSGTEEKNIAVVDNSQVIAPTLQTDGHVTFTSIDLPIDSLKNSPDWDAILVIGQDVVSCPDSVKMYVHGASSMQTEQFIQSQLNNTIRNIRLKNYDIPNLDDILDEVNVQSHISIVRIDGDKESESSSFLSYMIGTTMSLLLYMFIMIYGQMVMNSIIEEKNNRVLELIVTSVRPTQLMIGKILGIGLVAITQILIWGVLMACVSRWVMPLISGSLGADADVDLLAAMSQLGDTNYIIMIFVWLLLLLIGGYLFYSTLYAAIGSAVDNVQDASQLTTLTVVPVILGLVLAMSAVADPNSSLAFWASMIPFTSPMVMMARVPFGIDTWQILLSLAILYASFFGMAWVSAKIYRIGIFMYGKKPTLAEIIRWARYK